MSDTASITEPIRTENPELTAQEIKDILESNAEYEMGNISEVNLNDF